MINLGITITDIFSGFWAWFPLGPAGIRACLLFMSMLCVFMLRISQTHIGTRTAPAPFDTTKRFLIPFVADSSLSHSFNTCFWYLASAWWFSEVYIWSAENAGLGWVNPIKYVYAELETHPMRLTRPSKRDYELNERPIYLRAALITVAFVQAFRHLHLDYDCLRIPVSLPRSESSDQRTHPVKSVPDQMRSDAKARVKIFSEASKVAVLTTISFPFIYTLLFRSVFWSWHLAFAKIMYRISRSSEHPGRYPPANPRMMIRSAWVQFLLLLLWEIASFLFSAFLIQEPLKKGQSLSATTKDPNGTLLNGLKAKKDIVKTFAFWELVLISQKSPERRKAIFSDIDRAGSPTWSQMLESGLEVVRSVQHRIDPMTIPDAGQKVATLEKEAEDSNPLPRLTPKRASSPNILATPKKRPTYEEIIDAAVRKGLGSSQPWTPERTAKVKAAVVSAVERSHVRPRQQIGILMNYILSTPLGWFFRERPLRYVQSLVLGSPHSKTVILIDAIESVKRMSVASLSEDTYGKVQGTVPEVIRTFTNTIRSIEGFVSVMAGEEGEKVFVDVEPERLRELLMVDRALREALRELLDAFRLFLQHAGMDEEEIGVARVWAAETGGTKAGEGEWRRKAERVERVEQERQQQQRQRREERRRVVEGKGGGIGIGGAMGGIEELGVEVEREMEMVGAL